MWVETAWFDKSAGAFDYDIILAKDAASAANDPAARKWIDRLVWRYFEVDLPASVRREGLAHLSGLKVWRTLQDWSVFKTVDTPCMAYTAEMNDEDRVTLTALALCYRYPDQSSEVWWQTVVQVRLQKVIDE